MAAPDPSLNSILKWSIEASNPSSADPTSTQPAPRAPDAAALAALFGSGPSDAELMKLSMEAVLSSSVALADKLIAFDNLEQLLESLDNANNLAPLELWAPLIRLLRSEERELRVYAAWCVGTAVQNNEQTQLRALQGGAAPLLVRIALGRAVEGAAGGEEAEVLKERKKGRYAVSSLIRNFQPGVDEVAKVMKEEGVDVDGKVDSGDMEGVDGLLAKFGV